MRGASARVGALALLTAVVQTMRPRQWVKNLFVVAPLVFAERALDLTMGLHALLAFAVFSALSGCVYLLNDIVDVEADRLHPSKRRRPIAAGRLPIATARLALGLLLLGSVVAAFATLPIGFALIGCAYFTLNVAYSLVLKHIPFIDVLTIAGGFVMRLVGGAIAIAVPMTWWIALTTFALAIFLALGKRRHEIQQAGAAKKAQRRVLARYRLKDVSRVMGLFAFLTVGAYAGWTAFGDPAGRLFHPRDLAVTIPFVLFGLFRFYALSARQEDGASPTDRMLSDPPFVINVVLWCIAVAVIIYAH